MKNLSRIVSIMLIFVMLFSLHPIVSYADSKNDLQDLADLIAGQLKVKEFHVTDEETKDVTSQTFVTLPSKSQLPSGTGSGAFSYDEESGKIKYLSHTGKDTQTVTVEISYGDRILNASDIMSASNGDTLITVPDFLDESGSYKSYEGKELQIVLRYDDGTEVTVQKTLSEDDVKSEDISPGHSLWDWFKDNVLAWVFKPVEKALRVLEEVLTGLLIALGDEILTQVSQAVGEPVTIDRVIFGNVSKVSINFWDGSGYLSGKLKGVIEPWYNTFSGIAVVVYLAILLVIGIQIVFSSTGSGRAKYQVLLVDWVVGVGLLFLFPYVMKIAVEVNTALVRAINPGDVFEPTVTVTKSEESKLLALFGADDFVKEMVGDGTYPPETNQGMMYIRYLAGKQGRIPLAVVYLIMIYQLIVILFVYYKRAFMIAFLIVIFPLVAMTYTLDKLRWRSYKNTSI